MVKDIIIFYYLPIGIFIAYCCCDIIAIIVYRIKKTRIIVPVLLYCIALTGISVIYIYPINMYIYGPQYVCIFLIIFIGIYCALLAMVHFESGSSLRDFIHHVFAKSLVVLFFMILSKDIDVYQKIIIPGFDMILSSSMLFVKPKILACYSIHFPHRGSLMFMILTTICYCMVIMDNSVALHSLIAFSVLTVCTIRLIAKIFICICNDSLYDYIKINDEQLYTGEKYNALIKIIKEHVKEYYNSPIDKYTIALQCEMHPDYISKVFKNEEGMTINKYIQIVRLEKARHLLLYSDKKIIEVAFDVGYENLATFYRHFVKQYKKSPQQIRKEKLTK